MTNVREVSFDNADARAIRYLTNLLDTEVHSAENLLRITATSTSEVTQELRSRLKLLAKMQNVLARRANKA